MALLCSPGPEDPHLRPSGSGSAFSAYTSAWRTVRVKLIPVSEADSRKPYLSVSQAELSRGNQKMPGSGRRSRHRRHLSIFPLGTTYSASSPAQHTVFAVQRHTCERSAHHLSRLSSSRVSGERMVARRRRAATRARSFITGKLFRLRSPGSNTARLIPRDENLISFDLTPAVPPPP